MIVYQTVSPRLKDCFAITEVAVQNYVAICQYDPGIQEINHAVTDYKINTATKEIYKSLATYDALSIPLQLQGRGLRGPGPRPGPGSTDNVRVHAGFWPGSSDGN
jgi:hypothetical protein